MCFFVKLFCHSPLLDFAFVGLTFHAGHSALAILLGALLEQSNFPAFSNCCNMRQSPVDFLVYSTFAFLTRDLGLSRCENGLYRILPPPPPCCLLAANPFDMDADFDVVLGSDIMYIHVRRPHPSSCHLERMAQLGRAQEAE